MVSQTACAYKAEILPDAQLALAQLQENFKASANDHDRRNRVFVFVPCGRRNRNTDPPGHAAVIVTVFLLKEETSMEQIIKHFTPAMAAFAVGVLLIGILVAVLSSNGVVAEQMNKIITGFFEAASAQLPA